MGNVSGHLKEQRRADRKIFYKDMPPFEKATAQDFSDYYVSDGMPFQTLYDNYDVTRYRWFMFKTELAKRLVELQGQKLFADQARNTLAALNDDKFPEGPEGDWTAVQNVAFGLKDVGNVKNPVKAMLAKALQDRFSLRGPNFENGLYVAPDLKWMNFKVESDEEIAERKAKDLAKKELRKENEMLVKLEQSVMSKDAAGLLFPGTHYLGPGNPVPNGPPVDKLDAAAAKHDIRYDAMLKHGDIPYLKHNWADEAMSRDLEKDEPKSWVGNAARALWQAKKTTTKVVAPMMNSVLPVKPIQSEWSKVSKTEVDSTSNSTLSSPQKCNRKSVEKETATSKEATAKKKKRPRPKGSSESSGPVNHNMASSGNGNGLDSDMGDGGGGEHVDKEAAGGGGGAPECGGSWWGGSKVNGHHLTTFQTRRCILSPWPDQYRTQYNYSLVPEVVHITPWSYIDLNSLSAHFSPHDFYQMIENADAFRPRAMTVKIHELVFKDVGKKESNSETTVADSGSAFLSLINDSNYDFPYVSGAGQDTVPGHLPGQPYNLPLYAYTTVGVVGTICEKSRSAKTLPTQNSEFYLLENHPAKLLHSGQCWEHTYHFPELPFEKLTQYVWDTRRQYNPIQTQRFVLLKRPAGQETSTDETAQKAWNNKLQDQFNKHALPYDQEKMPSQWLQGPRHADGDLIIIHDWDRMKSLVNQAGDCLRGVQAPQPKKARLTGEPPLIVTRDTFKQLTVYSRSETLQPGPQTQQAAEITPDGTTIISANTVGVIEKAHEKMLNPGAVEGYMRLPLLQKIGHQDPTDPRHIREVEYPKTAEDGWGNVGTSTTKEVSYALMPGQVLEKPSGHLESQIWTKIPNTDDMTKPTIPLLSLWAMHNPPPQVFLRMFPQFGPPGSKKFSASVQTPTFLNQYCQFLLSYSIEWELIPRSHRKAQWNPEPNVAMPTNIKGPPFQLSGSNDEYHLPTHLSMMRQRARTKR
uniref:Capsid protein n=4 Tax=Parvovirinae TaxID=40119 RepID=A0A894YX64_9VIRU|nr:capsid protein [Copiparvovirus ungulate6]